MEFPQYRKLEGFGRFYRIDNERHFTEKYELKDSWTTHEVAAEQYPEILRIQDMLNEEFSFRKMTDTEIKHVFG
jgi:hypothetical protein